MSNNYYAVGPFPGGEGEGLHIGQHILPLRFLMRAHPDRDLTTLAAWEAFLRRADVTILDEYGCEITVGDLHDLVMRRFNINHEPLPTRWVHGYERPDYHVDHEGVEFCATEFS